MKNEKLRKDVTRLVKKGVSQIKVSSRLHLSRERVNQICDEVFGKGVAVFGNTLDSAGKFFLEYLELIMKRKSIWPLLWVAKEADRRGFKVTMLLNGNRDEYNILLINGFRVAVYVTERISLYKPRPPLPGFPAYHWEVRKKTSDAEYFILLAFFEGLVRYVVILPSYKAQRNIYLFLTPKLPLYSNRDYIWNHVGKWRLLSGKKEDGKLRESQRLRRAA